MSRGEGFFFENSRGRIVTGAWVRGETRVGGSPLKKVGVLTYRNGAFFIEPIAGSGPVQIGTSPGQVHPGTVALG